MLLLCLLSASLQNHLDYQIRQKLLKARGTFDYNRIKPYVWNFKRSGVRFAVRAPISEILADKRNKTVYKIPNKPIYRIFQYLLPFEALKYSRRYESFRVSYTVNGKGKLSYADMEAYLGVKYHSGTVEIRSVLGIGSGETRQQYNEERVRKCKKKLFKKKCWWENVKTPRGLTQQEVQNVKDGLIYHCLQSVLEIVSPYSQTGVQVKLDQGKDKVEVELIGGVEKDDLVKVLEMRLGENLGDLELGVGEFKVEGAVVTVSEGEQDFDLRIVK